MKNLYRIHVLFFAITISFSGIAIGQTDINLPKQLVGNCIENNGQGLLDEYMTPQGPSFSYNCHVPVYFETDAALNRSDFMNTGLRIENHTENLYKTPYGNTGALLLGFLGQGYINTKDGRAIALNVRITCAPYKKKCNVSNLRNAALLLGDMSRAKAKAVSNRSTGGYPSAVCIAPGPGYPRGPDCLEYAAVDTVSGSYCLRKGDYALGEPYCLEYGNLGPKYP